MKLWRMCSNTTGLVPFEWMKDMKAYIQRNSLVISSKLEAKAWLVSHAPGFWYLRLGFLLIEQVLAIWEILSNYLSRFHRSQNYQYLFKGHGCILHSCSQMLVAGHLMKRVISLVVLEPKCTLLALLGSDDGLWLSHNRADGVMVETYCRRESVVRQKARGWRRNGETAPDPAAHLHRTKHWETSISPFLWMTFRDVMLYSGSYLIESPSSQHCIAGDSASNTENPWSVNHITPQALFKNGYSSPGKLFGNMCHRL